MSIERPRVERSAVVLYIPPALFSKLEFIGKGEEGDERAHIPDISTPSTAIKAPRNHTAIRVYGLSVAGAVQMQFGDDIGVKYIGE